MNEIWKQQRWNDTNGLIRQAIYVCAHPSGRAVCSRSPAGIAVSNPAGDMDVCLL